MFSPTWQMYAVCLVLATLELRLTSQAIDNSQSDTVVIIEAASYNSSFVWTREEMLAARPKSMPVLDESQFEKHSGPIPLLARSRRGSDSHEAVMAAIEQPPDSDAMLDGIGNSGTMKLPMISDDEARALGIEPDDAAQLMDASEAVVEEADVNTHPFDAMGKLLFTTSDGSRWECSAQYVAPNIVLTAAHCIYSVTAPKGFHSNFVFLQQYDGPNTGTRIKALHQVLYQGWKSNDKGNHAYDFGFLIMEKRTATGRYLSIDLPDNYNVWTAAGYPGNFNNGMKLVSFRGRKGQVKDDIVQTLEDPMTQGCSGGGWIVNAEDGSYKVVGLNSFFHEGSVGMFSPKFRKDRIIQLFNNAVTKAGR